MLPGEHKVCRELDLFSLRHEHHGRVTRTHLWSEVLHNSNGWATLLCCYQEFQKGEWLPPAFKLVRLRKVGPLWYRMDTFNLKSHHMPGMMAGTARALGQEAR